MRGDDARRTYEQRLRISQHHGAVVDLGASGAHAAGEEHAGLDSRIHGEVDAVIDLRPLPELRCLAHLALDLAEPRRVDVIEPADLVAAAAGEARIGRRGNAVRLEVRRRHRGIGGCGEAAEPRPEVARAHGHARPQLVLDGP